MGHPVLSGLRSRAQDFLGTQGDGNHFAYIGRIQFTEAAREILLVLGANKNDYPSFRPYGAGRNLSRTAMLAPFKDAEGELDPARVQRGVAVPSIGL